MARKLFYAAVCTLVFTFAAFAQETTAGIRGIVKDPSGAVIAGATVTVTSPALIGQKTATSDSAGIYHIDQLPPGVYEVTTKAPGFSPENVKDLRLDAGSLPSLNFALKVGQAEQTVEVNAESAMVDVTQSKVAVTITQDILENTPHGRSFQSVIPFAPGARQEQLQSKTTDQGKLNGFQIDGASDAENVYMTEGLNTTSIYGGGVGANVPMEFVQEVQVKSSSFEAEFGGATGGVVNVVQKRGGQQWHGGVFTYYQGSPLSANDNCINRQIGAGVTTCNLRLQPGTKLNQGSAANLWADRLDGTAQRYIQQQDKWSIIEPGYEVGGPLHWDRLRFFSSYVPSLYNVTRNVNFTGANSGPHSFTQTSNTHYFMNRLDYSPINSLQLHGSWQSAFNRTRGVNLPGPDSPFGQVNTSAGTDPNTLRADTGTVNPQTILNFGADWTATSRMVVTARYGSFYTNSEDRGKPSGTRYVWQDDTTCKTNPDGTKTWGCGLDPATQQHTQGFANMPSNAWQAFDIFSRRQLNTDVSYLVGNFFGSHSLKAGYAVQRQAEDVKNFFSSSLVNVFMSNTENYSTASGPTSTVCASVIAKYGKCAGPYGYYTLRDGVLTNGNVSALNHSIYGQDGWTVKGLTINAGVRFDKEFLPPYRPGASSIGFGFTQKIAPRIGAAYDLFHNGKVKLYGSYGKFFDIMKYSLPRGSFGGDRWHDCVYALTTPVFTQIIPNNVNGKFCPDSGPAGGSLPGDFIENQNWRASAPGDPTDPVVDPNMHPMATHEFVGGADWEMSPSLTFESRYARKRLDWTIEDMSLDDGQYYIGNPGSAYSQLLHRPLPSAGFSTAVCPSCPNLPKAQRDYDGVEFRLIKRMGDRWLGQVSYTYSRLYGNYPGLSDTYFLDGGGGRHEPNNNRAFDLPQMLFDAHGKPVGGPLPTDRPNVFSGYGYYRLKWLGQETDLGLVQQFDQGSPQSTCLPTVDSQSSCMFVEGQGNWVNFHQDPATGDIVRDSITQGKRTPWLMSTDLSLTHEIHVSKSNENLRLQFRADVFNILNQHAALNLYNSPLATGVTTPEAGGIGWDYLSLMTNFDYMSLMNNKTTGLNSKGQVVYAGPNVNGAPNTLASRYGQPTIYQNARNMRLQMRFIF